jgi:hypothetical protein
MGLSLVGFSGRPVVSGAGLKPALLFDSETGRYAVLTNGCPGTWWTEAEMVEHEARSLVTLTRTAEPFVDSAVALYAHMRFVSPSPSESVSEAPIPAPLAPPPSLFLIPRIEAYVGFPTREDAIAILDRWAQSLLEAARRALGESNVRAQHRGRAALAEAMRARYALAGRDEPSARSARREAFALAWAGMLLQGIATDTFRTDASIEFPDAELARIERDAAEFFFSAACGSRGVRRGYRDQRLARHRQMEDAA